MKNNTRKIVVLDGLNSQRIEQAIFILRDASSISVTDAVSEAERIVTEYLASQSHAEPRKERKKSRAGFFFGMLAYTLSTILLTTYILINFIN